MANVAELTAYNSGYAVSLPSVATPKLPFATLRATSHSRKRYMQCGFWRPSWPPGNRFGRIFIMGISGSVVRFLGRKWILAVIILVLIAAIYGSLMDEIAAMNAGTTCSFGFFFIIFIGPIFIAIITVVLSLLFRSKRAMIFWSLTYLVHFIIQFSLWLTRRSPLIQRLARIVWPILVFNLYNLKNRFDWKTAIIVGILWSIVATLVFMFISWMMAKEGERG